jgi:hypothetical protein
MVSIIVYAGGSIYIGRMDVYYSQHLKFRIIRKSVQIKYTNQNEHRRS